MRLGVIGRNDEGLRYEINGGVVFFHLMGNHAKQMQGARLIGVALQYLLIDALGLAQATRGVVPQCEVHGFLDG